MAEKDCWTPVDDASLECSGLLGHWTEGPVVADWQSRMDAIHRGIAPRPRWTRRQLVDAVLEFALGVVLGAAIGLLLIMMVWL